MKKRVSASFLAAVMMASAAAPVFADEYTADVPAEVMAVAEDSAVYEAMPAEVSQDVAAEGAADYVPQAFTYTDLTDDTAEYEAALPAKPTVAVKTAFGGKTLTFSCADTDAEIYYNFGSSNITTSSKHVKAGGTVFISEPMATGIYFRSYKNGKWSRETGKQGFNNVRIAKPIITVENTKYMYRCRLYTQTSNSYMVYTLDGSEPAVEEGTQKLKVKNGRIVWGTSEYVTVPSGCTLKAIAIRCGLVTSDVSVYKNPNTSKPLSDHPDIKDCGFDIPYPNAGEVHSDECIEQAGIIYCSDTQYAQGRINMYIEKCRKAGFTVEELGSLSNAPAGATRKLYFLYFNGKRNGFFIGSYEYIPDCVYDNKVRTSIVVYLESHN